MQVAGMAASVEPSGGYLNRQPKVAGKASCTFINVLCQITFMWEAQNLNILNKTLTPEVSTLT